MKRRVYAVGRLRCVALAAACLLGAGCSASHLAYVSDTSVGVDVSISGSEGTQKLVVGFDREVYALVPRVTNPDVPGLDDVPESMRAEVEKAWNDRDGDEPHGPDAMNLVAVSEVYMKGLSNMKFDHILATGAGAIGLALDPEGLEKVRDGIFSESTTEAFREHAEERDRSIVGDGGGK